MSTSIELKKIEASNPSPNFIVPSGYVSVWIEEGSDGLVMRAKKSDGSMDGVAMKAKKSDGSTVTIGGSSPGGNEPSSGEGVSLSKMRKQAIIWS